MILVGYGYWGQVLARVFEQELLSICDVNVNVRKEVNEKYSNKKVFSNLDDCIKDHRGKKVAIVCNNATAHFDTAKTLLENGYDLWIEKPVVLTIEELDILIYIAEKNSCVVLVDHTYCYDDNIQKIKKIGLGDPLYYRSLRLANGPIRNDVTALYDLAIHDLSIIDFLYPNLKIKTSTLYDVNTDHNILQLKFTNGFKATIEYNWSFPIKKRLIVAKGTNATVVHDSADENILELFDKNLNKLDTYVNKNETLTNVKNHFLMCIECRQLPRTNLYNARKIMGWLK
jgi:predicted dehydrogenase